MQGEKLVESPLAGEYQYVKYFMKTYIKVRYFNPRKKADE